jgi:DNA-directed RNA polymerase subunit delta
MYSDFKKMAYGFNKDYNSPLFYSDEEQQNLEGVECPFCGERIYFDEWDEYSNEWAEDSNWDKDSDWAVCPFCGNKGIEDKSDEDYEDYDDDEEDDEWAEDEDEEDK